MKLGAGHPMGPLALLDFVGLDVAVAIGEAIGAEVPERVRAAGRRGRARPQDAAAGFYDYDRRRANGSSRAFRSVESARTRYCPVRRTSQRSTSSSQKHIERPAPERAASCLACRWTSPADSLP